MSQQETMAERAIHSGVYSSLSQCICHPVNREHVSRNAIVDPVHLGIAQHILKRRAHDVL
jgi:hypothetical protein